MVKELWDALHAKYLTDDATSKKFLISQFMNYRMIDNKSVINQLHEIQHILNQFKVKTMNMDEPIILYLLSLINFHHHGKIIKRNSNTNSRNLLLNN